MKVKGAPLTALILLFTAFDLSASASHAYLDPGIGSQGLQLAVAGILGLAFTLRGFFARLFPWVRRKR